MSNPEYYQRNKEILKAKELIRYYANREKKSEYQKEYYKKHKEECKKVGYLWREKNKAAFLIQHRKHAKKYIKKYPNKILAQTLAKRKIKILKNTSCKICSGKSNLERHHSDYTKPLKVDILCKVCHRKIHRGDLYL